MPTEPMHKRKAIIKDSSGKKVGRFSVSTSDPKVTEIMTKTLADILEREGDQVEIKKASK